MKRLVICFFAMGMIFFISILWILENPMFGPDTALARNTKVLKANQLIIVDKKGNLRVAIKPAGRHGKDTALWLWDSKGVRRFSLTINPDSRPPTVTYYDKAGKKIDHGPSPSSPLFNNPAVTQAAFGPVLGEIKRLSDEIEKLKTTIAEL